MSNLISKVLKSNVAVMNSCLAAGVTISFVTLVQSVGIVLSWLH
jgi:hypothetical protein